MFDLSNNTTYYLYDSLNRLTTEYRAGTNSYTRRYSYDSVGNRLSMNSAIRIQPTANSQKTPSENLSPESCNLFPVFYHYDPIGNVLFVSDSSGNINTSYVQEGFGNVIATNGSANNYFHLTTKEQDPYCGIYYFSARWYDPQVGRFISKDPVRYVNRYSYVKNNPLKHVDPLGLCGGWTRPPDLGSGIGGGEDDDWIHKFIDCYFRCVGAGWNSDFCLEQCEEDPDTGFEGNRITIKIDIPCEAPNSIYDPIQKGCWSPDDPGNKPWHWDFSWLEPPSKFHWIWPSLFPVPIPLPAVP